MTTSTWQQLHIILPQELAESVCAWLEEQEQTLSVTLTDAGNEPLFQEYLNQTPLWQNVKIEALFMGEEDITPLITDIKQHYPQLLDLTTTVLNEQDWVRLTQSQFPPQCFAQRLWVYPSWQSPPSQLQPMVRIDPGLAFGTGTHPTTALCLEWLATQNLNDHAVIDFGCGSGILALAALALGAQPVWAVDHDPQALIATANNATLNDFATAQHFQIITAAALPDQPVQLLIANILAKPLLELAPLFHQCVTTNGRLVLSGLLSHEVNMIIQAYQPNFTLATQTERDGWACLVFKR